MFKLIWLIIEYVIDFGYCIYLILKCFVSCIIIIGTMFSKHKKKMSCEEYKAYVLKQNSKGKRLSKHLTNKQVIKQVWGY